MAATLHNCTHSMIRMHHSVIPIENSLWKLWKLPRGRRGCAASIVRVVAPVLFRAPWGQMTLALSRPTASRFEEMLSHDWFNVAVFQVCFLAQECLSCSCHACSLKNVRAGTVCPVDQSYTTFEAAGPDSPREPAAAAMLCLCPSSHCLDLAASIACSV